MSFVRTPFTPLLCASVVALSGLSACGLDSGHDYPVTVTWLINGRAPSAASCREQGVDRIRLTVEGPSKTRTVEGRCESKIEYLDENDESFFYGGFDTTDSFTYDVVYRYKVEMIGVNGAPIPQVFTTDSFQVFYGDEEPWPLNPLELFSPYGSTASFTAGWTINGVAPTKEACQRLGATQVAIDAASSTDPDFVDWVNLVTVDCDSGSVRTDRVLAEGDYFIRYSALNAQDDSVQDVYIDEEVYAVDRVGEFDVKRVDFKLP